MIIDTGDSDWLNLRNALLDAFEVGDFPVERSDLYTPERRSEPAPGPAVVVGFSDQMREAMEVGENGFDESISFNVYIFGKVGDGDEADRMVAFTEQVIRFLTPVDEHGKYYEREVDGWQISDVRLEQLFNREMLYGANRRWFGLVKINCHRCIG